MEISKLLEELQRLNECLDACDVPCDCEELQIEKPIEFETQDIPKTEIKEPKLAEEDVKDTVASNLLKQLATMNLEKEESIEEKNETIDAGAVFDLDDKIANVENELFKIRQEIDKNPENTELVQKRDKLNNVLKGLKTKRDKKMDESKINEISNELADKVITQRKANMDNAVNKYANSLALQRKRRQAPVQIVEPKTALNIAQAPEEEIEDDKILSAPLKHRLQKILDLGFIDVTGPKQKEKHIIMLQGEYSGRGYRIDNSGETCIASALNNFGPTSDGAYRYGKDMFRGDLADCLVWVYENARKHLDRMFKNKNESKTCPECEVKKLIKQFESLEDDDELGLFIINDGDIYRQYSSKAQKDAKEGKDVDWDKITAIGARKYYKEIDKTPFTPEELKNTAEYIKDYYINESKINEISDKLANTVAGFRKANAYDAEQKFRALDDEHTAELTKIDNNYTNRDIMLGKADKDIDAVNAKYEPLENEQRKIIKKAEKNADLMAKRNARKNESKINEISDKLASKVVSKRMAQYKKEGDELDKQAADVVNAQNSLDPNVREIEKEYKNNLDNFFGGIKQKANKLYRTINKRAQRLGKENEYGQYFDSLRKNESKMNEISQETVDAVKAEREKDVVKKTKEYKQTGKEEDREIAKEAKDKLNKFNKLEKDWKKSKKIKESKDTKTVLVAKFQEGNNTHQIIKNDGKYMIRYNVNEDKALSSYGPIDSLSVAIEALMKRCPKAEQVK